MSISLQEAKDLVFLHLDDGISCPCCQQYARRYRRKFNSTMARSLIWLVREWRESDSSWVDVAKTAPRWLVRSNQLPTVRWWGLVERPVSEDPTRKHLGLWLPTRKGILFASNLLRLPSHAVTYRGIVEELNGGLISIHDALGDHFDYSELMMPISPLFPAFRATPQDISDNKDSCP